MCITKQVTHTHTRQAGNYKATKSPKEWVNVPNTSAERTAAGSSCGVDVCYKLTLRRDGDHCGGGSGSLLSPHLIRPTYLTSILGDGHATLSGDRHSIVDELD